MIGRNEFNKVERLACTPSENLKQVSTCANGSTNVFTMGRRKIAIQPITGERNLSATFLKRKHGLFKKAYELAVLTNSRVAVMVLNRNGKLFEFCSDDMEEFLMQYINHIGAKERRGRQHFTRLADEEPAAETTDTSVDQANRPQEVLDALHGHLTKKSSQTFSPGDERTRAEVPTQHSTFETPGMSTVSGPHEVFTAPKISNVAYTDDMNEPPSPIEGMGTRLGTVHDWYTRSDSAPRNMSSSARPPSLHRMAPSSHLPMQEFVPQRRWVTDMPHHADGVAPSTSAHPWDARRHSALNLAPEKGYDQRGKFSSMDSSLPVLTPTETHGGSPSLAQTRLRSRSWSDHNSMIPSAIPFSSQLSPPRDIPRYHHMAAPMPAPLFPFPSFGGVQNYDMRPEGPHLQVDSAWITNSALPTRESGPSSHFHDKQT